MKQIKKTLAWLLVVCMIAPMISSVLTTQAEETTIADENNYDAMEMKDIMKLDKSLTWVFTGDSITHNDVWAQGMNSYSEWFEQYLYTIGRGSDAVINTAWGGAAIRDFQTPENTPPNNGSVKYGANHDAGEGLDKYVLSYNPDVVFIKLGMNDRQTGTTDEFIRYYKMMIDSIYEAGKENGKIPKIIVSSPTPVSDENVYDDIANSDRGETAVNNSGTTVFYDGTLRFRNALDELVKEYNGKGYHMIFNDLRTAFLDEAERLGDDYLVTFFREPSDGTIHPNAAGQYLIFKTLSKTLGIYDASKPIYQFEYDDINWAALYDGDTDGVTYANGYADDVVAQVNDSAEMNKVMATINGIDPIASVDFSSTNGVLDMGGKSTTDGGSAGFSITKEGEGINPLTQTEAEGLETAFSVVFRARLENDYQTNQAVLFVSANGTASWNDALTVGTTGSEQQLWYRLYQGGQAQLNKEGQIKNLKGTNIAGDGSWHTVAIVQDSGTISYYVDGTLVDTATGYTLKSGVTKIGSLFEGATDFQAQIGRYGEIEGGPTFTVDGSFDYWQFYDVALTSAQVSELASVNTSDEKITWSDSITENYVWAIAGAEQVSGYNGLQVNRSLMRQLDNAMRGGDHSSYSQRDIRLVNAAAPGNTVASMIENYEEIIGKHNADVLLLLPEIPHVYADDYKHSEEAVADYKASVKALLAKSEAKVNILWSPLASGNDELNVFIRDYADAVREIAAENSSVLFFDANKFMNDNMTKNASLKHNWFDDDMYITPLASVDLAIAFYSSMDEEGAIPTNGSGTKGIRYSELISHNLRYTSDERVYKSEYVRDNIASGVEVSGTTVKVNVSAIKEEYKDAEIVLKVMPEVNAGNYHAGIRNLTEVTAVSVEENGNVYSFTAPCKDLHLAVYGKQGELVYRFKDISIVVEGAADKLPAKEVKPADGAYLTSLEVEGAPKLAFNKNTTSYDVNLYQYQQFVRIVAEAHEDLIITVNGKEVESGVRSARITVPEANKTETVTVKVSGTVKGEFAEQTYTLNLCRPEYPDIIVTEVMQIGYGDKYDLIEVYNASGKDLNLADYSIGYKRQYSPGTIDVDGETQYYFTGNDQALGHTLYTGINQITKASSYWNDEEPAEIEFKADSTMVIWVKQWGTSGTYENLINAMKVTPDKTLNVDIDGTDTEIIPNIDQLVVAEVPSGIAALAQGARINSLAKDSVTPFYLANAAPAVRNWLFVLKDGAVMAENGAITESGNDIISAARYNKISDVDGLSNVLSYNADRGMSLVKNESRWIDDTNAHTSDEQGYGTYTSFGAIEYWQKPYDLSDVTDPTVEIETNAEIKNGTEAQIKLALSDDTDVRYVELYYKNEGQTEWTKLTKDYVLEAGVQSGGVSADITETAYEYNLGVITGTTQYYGFVVDGNNNKTYFGTEKEPLTIVAREIQTYTAADVADFKSKNTYPEPDGYLFGGWYTDEECETSPVTNVKEVTGTVYALFVPKSVLSVKAQLSENLVNDIDTDDSTGNIRFVTTVDSLRYQTIGFKISFVKDGKEVKQEVASEKVYTKLFAVGATEGKIEEYSPKLFNLASNYFKACTVKGIPEAYYGVEFTVTPFWITLDGTLVEGLTEVKAINDGVYEAKLGDTYYTTLEEAVAVANTSETASTITVLRDVEVSTPMSIDKNVTIQNADGLDVTIYRGEGLRASSMFNVGGGATLTVKSVEDSGSLTLDGRAEADKEVTNTATLVASSASLIVNAGTTTVENVTVQYAKAAANGGAINNTGTLNVNDATFKNNLTSGSAYNGGAIWNEGTLTITGTDEEKAIFEGNVAGKWSGAVHVEKASSTVNISGYTFKGNTATAGGAMVLFRASSLTNNVFEGNSLTGASNSGGAVYANTSQTFINCDFISNTSNLHGGAVYTSVGQTFTNCNFISNTAKGNGGAVYGITSGTITCEDSTFISNSADTEGGAIYNDSNCTWIINSCQFEDNSAPQGGAIMIGTKGSVTLNVKENSKVTPIFKNNKATGANGGGAIGVWRTGKLNVTGYQFVSNQVVVAAANDNQYSGGAIAFVHSNAYTSPNTADATTSTIKECDFISNSAYNGGAIYSKIIRHLTIEDCDFKSNSADRWGGAVCLIGTGYTATFTSTNSDNVFEGNTATSAGGALVLSTSNATTATITGYKFKNNNSGAGKSVWMGACTLELKKCTFDQANNVAFDKLNYKADSETKFGVTE